MHLTVNFFLHTRKRLDGNLQDLEEKQNSKKEAVCILPFHMHTHMRGSYCDIISFSSSSYSW